jgi:hypothetical protein
MEQLIETAVNHVEDMCAPEKMSKKEALEFLRDVALRLSISADAIQEDIQREKDGEHG